MGAKCEVVGELERAILFDHGSWSFVRCDGDIMTVMSKPNTLAFWKAFLRRHLKEPWREEYSGAMHEVDEKICSIIQGCSNKS